MTKSNAGQTTLLRPVSDTRAQLAYQASACEEWARCVLAGDEVGMRRAFAAWEVSGMRRAEGASRAHIEAIVRAGEATDRAVMRRAADECRLLAAMCDKSAWWGKPAHPYHRAHAIASGDVHSVDATDPAIYIHAARMLRGGERAAHAQPTPRRTPPVAYIKRQGEASPFDTTLPCV